MNRLLLLCSLFLAAETFCLADVVLSVSPVSQSVTVGSPVSFDIDASGLGNGTALGTYDINLGFDPTLLSYANITFGTGLDVLGLGDIQGVTPGNGTVEVFELSLDSVSDLETLQPSSFKLATLTFKTLATGTNSPITLSVNALGDALGNSITANLQNGSVTINGATTSTPEPASIALLLSGGSLLFMTGWRTRRNLNSCPSVPKTDAALIA